MVGVPLIVSVLAAYVAVTPAGRLEEEVTPVTPVVACVIFVMAVLTQTVGEDDAAPTEHDTTAPQVAKFNPFAGGAVVPHPVPLLLPQHLK